MPSKNLESVASRPSLSFAYLTYALDKTTNSFSARRFLLQNRVIQFHEARHVYYGEINYYVPDVSRYSFRARTGLFPFHYHCASAKSRIRSIERSKEFLFVYNYIYTWLLFKNDLCECVKFTSVITAGFATVNVIDAFVDREELKDYQAHSY